MRFGLAIPLAALLALSASALSQVTITPDVKATYLQTRSDDFLATTAVPIPLALISATAGTWIRVSTLGAYNSTGSDTRVDVTCCFSSSGGVLPANQLNRLPGALAAGPTVTTSVFQVGNNIPQDFYATDQPTYVQVPAGAIFLFLSTVDDFKYGENVDPNNDFRVVLAAAAPPSILPGTQEHCVIRSGVSPQPAAAFPDRYQAAANSLITVSVHDRWGFRAGDPVLLMADFVTTPIGVPGPVLPGLYLGPTAVILTGSLVSSTPLSYFVFVPPGFGGNSLVFQAGFIGPAARNGIFMSSDMHVVDL